MNILVLNYEFPPLGGGGGYVAKAISELLARKGHDVDFVTMRFKDWPQEEMINSVRVLRVNSLRQKEETCTTLEMASFVAAAIPFVSRLMRHKVYDAVHCHFAIPTGIIARMVRQCRKVGYIITTHGSDIPGYNPDRFRWEHRFTRPLLKSIMNNAKAVIAPSEYLKDLIIRNVCPRCPVTVIPNGITPGMFDMDKPRLNRILMSGRLLERKGIQWVLKALRDADLARWEIHIAGDGPYRSTLEDLAAGLKTKVLFHGWLHKGSPEWKELYETAKIFILTSEVENAPIALLEAMNAGLAVITSDSTGCRETAGDTALLVDPRDMGAIKLAVERLAQNDDLMRDMGMKARARTITNFSWDKIVDEYLKLYTNGV